MGAGGVACLWRERDGKPDQVITVAVVVAIMGELALVTNALSGFFYSS